MNFYGHIYNDGDGRYLAMITDGTIHGPLFSRYFFDSEGGKFAAAAWCRGFKLDKLTLHTDSAQRDLATSAPKNVIPSRFTDPAYAKAERALARAERSIRKNAGSR